MLVLNSANCWYTNHVMSGELDQVAWSEVTNLIILRSFLLYTENLGLENPGAAFQAWDEKDAVVAEEEFSLEDLFGDDEPAKVEL